MSGHDHTLEKTRGQAKDKTHQFALNIGSGRTQDR